MARLRITDLPTAVAAAAGDLFAVVQSAVTRQISLSGIAEGVIRVASAFIAAGTGAVARTPQDKLRESLSFKDFGAFGNGVSPDQAALQKCFDAAVAAGVTAYGPPGIYLLTTKLTVASGLKLVMDPACVLLRGYTEAGTTGLLQNASFLSKVSHVSIRGGEIRNTDTTTYQGNQICLYGDDIWIDDLYLNEWGTTSRAIVIDGDRNRVTRVVGIHTGLGGGIRVIGGDAFMGYGCYIKCGDDCYNFVPGGFGAALFDHSITNSFFADCTGYSTAGRLFLAALSGSGVLDMTASLVRIGFHNIRGKAGGRAFIVYNEDSTGSIQGVDITDCSIDCTDNVSQGNEGFINGGAGTGGVYDVRIKNLEIKNPYKEVIEISGIVDRVYVNGFRFEAPRDSSAVVIDLKAVTSATFKDGYMAGNGQDLVSVAGSAANVLLEGITFDAIADAQSAVNVSSGTNVTIRKCKMNGGIGATTHKAFITGVGARYVTFEENDCRAVTSTTKFTDSGMGTVVSRNLGLSDFAYKITFEDDFLGRTLDSNVWAVHKGSDGACSDFAILADQARGLCRGTTGAGAGATMAVNGIQIDTALNWIPSQGGLTMSARIQPSSAAALCLFVGFTDQNSALEMPFTLAAGDALTPNATDAVGFLFDTAADTDDWWLVGVKAGSPATKQDVGSAPPTGSMSTLRIEVNGSGTASFYLNGVQVGSDMSNSTSTGVQLTPVIAAFARTGTSRNITVDDIKIEATR
jgi:hypothetical protein